MTIKQSAENAVFGFPKNVNNTPSTQGVSDLFDLVAIHKETAADLKSDTSLSTTGGSAQEVSVGDIVKTSSEGYSYEVVASGGDLVTDGGVNLDIADDATNVNALGATDVADPSGRDTFAPALVTSAQSRRLYGVELRDLLGRNYNPSNDAGAVLSGFIAELAPQNIVINDTRNLEVLCTEPIRPESGMQLRFGPGTTVKRGWAAASSDVDALMARASWSTDTDDFLIDGGVWTAASPTQTGRIFSFYGNRWEVRNSQILEYYGSQAMVFGGDDIRINNVKAITSDSDAGTGAFRMIGGRGFRGIGLEAICGDDLFQFVPVTDSANARYNLSISDSYYIGCHGQSLSARGLVAAIAGPQDEQLMTNTLRRIGWINCSTIGGNRNVAIENTEGDGTVDRQIDDVLISGCSLDGSEQDNLTAQDVNILSDFAGGIGRVTVRDTVVFGTDREHGVTIQAEDSHVVLDQSIVEAEGSAIDITDASRVDIIGGTYRIVNNGGTASGSHVVDVTVASAASEVRISEKPRFENIPSSRGAIRASSSTCRIFAGDIDAVKAPGATGTSGVSHAAGSQVSLGEVTGDVDSSESGGGIVRREPRVGFGGELTISSGSISLDYAYHTVDTEGDASTDDLATVVFPSWAGDGQMFTLRPANGGRTVVVKNGTGNIQCSNTGGDVTLDDFYDTFTGIKIGSDLVEVG